MIKRNVIALVGELIFPLLDRMVKDFIHPGNIGSGADHRRQILQGALQRVVQPGHHQQEQKEGQHIQTALHQNERGGHYKGRQAKFIDDRTPLHGTDFLLQPLQILRFGVVGF